MPTGSARSAASSGTGQIETSLRPADDPAVVAVQAAVLAATGLRNTPLLRSEALYDKPYVVRDVLRYRAAAIALGYVESELWRHYYYTRVLRPDERQRLDALYSQRLDFLAESPGRWWFDICPQSPFGEPSASALVEALTDWRSLYSITGHAYRSLDRTLMNLPEAVPANLVCHLHRVPLERPIVSSLQLTALLLRAAGSSSGHDATLNQLRALQHASEGEILRALDLVGAHTNRRLDPNVQDDLHFFVVFMADYPEPYQGSLGGLINRAIRWHREVARCTAAEAVGDRLGRTTPTTRPPIPLPEIAGLSFLDTVGAVINEGRDLQHCIAAYAEDAVAGRCFLFHAERDGEHASVEVTASGNVRQAVGPRNTRNAAAVWGAQQLHIWARPLRLRDAAIGELPWRAVRKEIGQSGRKGGPEFARPPRALKLSIHF